jgi:hypothetical protein
MARLSFSEHALSGWISAKWNKVQRRKYRQMLLAHALAGCAGPDFTIQNYVPIAASHQNRQMTAAFCLFEKYTLGIVCDPGNQSVIVTEFFMDSPERRRQIVANNAHLVEFGLVHRRDMIVG